MSGTLVMFGTSAAGSAPDNLELAALLCSRVCHDLISPVGAIVNGIEVIEDDNTEETKTFALDLIRKSAKTASARLRSEEHTSELQSHHDLVCRLLLEKKKNNKHTI